MERRSTCSTVGQSKANLSIMYAQEAVKYTQETTLSSSSSLESKQRSPRSSRYHAFERRVHFTNESDLSIRVVAQNVAKNTRETTLIPVSSPGAESKRGSSPSTSREAGQRGSSREAVHLTEMSITLAEEAVKYNQETTPLSSQGFILETKPRQRSRSRSTSHEAGQQRSSREAVTRRGQRRSSHEVVRFTGESDVSIMLDQDVQDSVKYTQETTRKSSSSLETNQCSSRSTSREAGRLPYRHRSRIAMHVTDKSDVSILAQALDVAKCNQETTRMSSPGVETKLQSSRSTSREAGQRRSSLKQRSPCSLSTSREAESAEIPYQHRSRSGRVHFDADESNLRIMTQNVAKYTQETTRMSSSGPDLETKRRSSCSTSLEAGHRRSSREAVHFTGESDLSIMLAQEAVKYSQETTFTKAPPQRFLAKIWASLKL